MVNIQDFNIHNLRINWDDRISGLICSKNFHLKKLLQLSFLPKSEAKSERNCLTHAA